MKNVAITTFCIILLSVITFSMFSVPVIAGGTPDGKESWWRELLQMMHLEKKGKTGNGGGGGNCPYTYGWQNVPCQNLVNPIDNGASCTSGFCKQRSSGWHRGLDLAFPGGDGANIGKPVYSAHTGTVKISEWSNTAGNWIIIKDDSNSCGTVYMHLSKRLVNSNDHVNIGQKIGEVGNTGDSDGAHLHFEVRARWNDDTTSVDGSQLIAGKPYTC